MKRALSIGTLVLLLSGAGCVASETETKEGTTPTGVASAVTARLAAGDTLSSAFFSADHLPDDVDKAQVGSAYELGRGDDAVLFLFVLQKNMNVPLLDLPANVETTWGGVLASTDDGASWQRFLSYENPKVELGAVRGNPVGMFVDGGTLYVDVADALGAGSGEGNLTRFVLGADGTAWTSGGCYYYVQERYAPTKDTTLSPSTNCLIEP